MWFPFLLLSITVTIVATRLLLSFGAPYVPVNDQRKRDLLELAGPVLGKKIIDLGSGDGRIVIAFAQAGAEAHGYEINPFLVSRARKLIKQENLQDRVFIHQKSFWRADLSPFYIVVVYGVGTMMRRLERKLQRELRSGAKVVSVYFKLPNWRSTRQLHDITLYVQPHDEHNRREKDKGL